MKGAEYAEGFIEKDELLARFKNFAEKSFTRGGIPKTHTSGASITIDDIVGRIIGPRGQT